VEIPSRYRFMKGCKIDMKNLVWINDFFNRIYSMSCKCRGLNQIVIKMNEYMKFHMNYV